MVDGWMDDLSVIESVSEKVFFEMKPEGSEWANSAEKWEGSFQAGWTVSKPCRLYQWVQI